jgi:DNA adenine methylase
MTTATLALAPWYGCKRSLCEHVVAEIGKHRSYWEPFCGSMAVLLGKPACSYETVNDLHGELVNLARVIKDEDTAVDLYSRLSRTIPAQEIFHEAMAEVRCRERAKLPADLVPDVARAESYFIASWTGMNGVAGTHSTNTNFCRRFTAEGGSPTVRFRRAVESIPWWHDRLRGVMVLSDDAFELLGRIADEEGTVIYCDPPYVAKSAKYRHDFSPEDHARLAKSLDRFEKTRVVLSYYDHPLLRELYQHGRWRWERIEVMRPLAVASRRGKRTPATELLLINDGEQRTLFPTSNETVERVKDQVAEEFK